jgi:hypothetical protein
MAGIEPKRDWHLRSFEKEIVNDSTNSTIEEPVQNEINNRCQL